jgi:hypothetical protein
MATPSRRDSLDDADRVELSTLGRDGGVPTRRSVEDEEANLVLGNVDRAVEADARRPLRQPLGGPACSPFAGGPLPGAATSEIGLDEVARHALASGEHALRHPRSPINELFVEEIDSLPSDDLQAIPKGEVANVNEWR